MIANSNKHQKPRPHAPYKVFEKSPEESLYDPLMGRIKVLFFLCFFVLVTMQTATNQKKSEAL